MNHRNMPLLGYITFSTARSGRHPDLKFDHLEQRLALSGPGISINDATIVEGNSGTAGLVFTVSLSTRSNKPVSVSFATANGTATGGADYSATQGTLSFAKGETTKTITVPILVDLLDEPDETFSVVLTGASGGTITRATGRGTIVDDDPAPSVSVGDVAVVEGAAGSATATLTIRLSAPSGKTVSVGYATADGSATAGLDYASTSGVLTFTPGQISTTISMSVLGDVLDEPDEAFAVNLSAPTNATIADGQGLVTIVDDDPAPTLSIDNPSIIEGNTGSRILTFTVSLSAPSGKTVSTSFATANGSATAGSDYSAATGTLSFAPGSTTATVGVTVLSDVVFEPDETFSLLLSGAVNASIAAGTGTGTIVNDDVPPSVSINDVGVTEGDSGTSSATFTVRLSAASSTSVTIDYATVDGSALAGSDYLSTHGTITFAPGQTTQAVTVPVIGDLIYEPTESFSVLLSNAVGATIADGRGDATIVDNDPSPLTISIDDAQIQEGNSGTRSLVFHIHLSAPSSGVEWAVISTTDGTAKAGSDYTALSGVGVTFLAGVTEQTISIPILGDVAVEPDETFTVTITRASRTISDAQAVGTIINDDLA